MIQWLREKWNVSAGQFWIIFIVFGCTGITTAYLTKAIIEISGLTADTHWVWKFLLRAGMLLIGYQIILLSFGAIFGQWKFFWAFEKKLLQKLKILKEEKKK